MGGCAQKLSTIDLQDFDNHQKEKKVKLQEYLRDKILEKYTFNFSAKSTYDSKFQESNYMDESGSEENDTENPEQKYLETFQKLNQDENMINQQKLAKQQNQQQQNDINEGDFVENQIESQIIKEENDEINIEDDNLNIQPISDNFQVEQDLQNKHELNLKDSPIKKNQLKISTESPQNFLKMQQQPEINVIKSSLIFSNEFKNSNLARNMQKNSILSKISQNSPISQITPQQKYSNKNLLFFNPNPINVKSLLSKQTEEENLKIFNDEDFEDEDEEHEEEEDYDLDNYFNNKLNK